MRRVYQELANGEQSQRAMKVLFAVSEAHPLIKTGGLADVAGGLCSALSQLGNDVRIILPYYASPKTQVFGN